MKYHSQNKTFSFVDSQINPNHIESCDTKCNLDKKTFFEQTKNLKELILRSRK